MAKKFADYQARVMAIVQPPANKLADNDRDEFIRQWILQRYSKDRPREIVSDVAGNGTNDLDLPSEATGAKAAFEDGFSNITAVEYPAGNVPETVLEEDDYGLYRSPAGLKVRLLSEQPLASESVRMTWTARHKSDGSTVPEPDFDAVCDGAASLCFSALAAVFAKTGDNTQSADVVNYRTKSQEFLGLAKEARKRYFDHIGIADGGAAAAAGNSGVSVPAVISSGEQDQVMGWGGDRITHNRRSR